MGILNAPPQYQAILFAVSIAAAVAGLVVFAIALWYTGKDKASSDEKVRAAANKHLKDVCWTLFWIFTAVFIFFEVINFVTTGSSVLVEIINFFIAVIRFIIDLLSMGININQ